MKSLIVVLEPCGEGDEEYCFAVAQGGNAVEHGIAPLVLLPPAKELVAVIPARMLSWHKIVAPKVNSARLRNALGGILEDRVLEDTQALHFAIEPGAQAGESAWVAACNKAWLQSALQAFESTGLRVSRVVAEYAPSAPGNGFALHITGTPGNAWAVRCSEDGVQTLPLLPEVEAAFRQRIAKAETEKASFQLFAAPEVAALCCQVLGRAGQLQGKAGALVAAARSGWDLAQFDLASTSSTRLAKRSARMWAHCMGALGQPARWGFAAFMVANLLGLNVWAWQERSALENKRAEMSSLLIKTFPSVTVVANAPLQMERELKSLRRQSGAASHRDLETMLAVVAANSATTHTPTGIDYASSELTLKGFRVEPVQAAALSQRLTRVGYSSRANGETLVIRADGAGDFGNAGEAGKGSL